MRLLRAIQDIKPDVVWFNLLLSTFGNNPVAAFAGVTVPPLMRLSGYYTHVTLHHSQLAQQRSCFRSRVSPCVPRTIREVRDPDDWCRRFIGNHPLGLRPQSCSITVETGTESTLPSPCAGNAGSPSRAAGAGAATAPTAPASRRAVERS